MVEKVKCTQNEINKMFRLTAEMLYETDKMVYWPVNPSFLDQIVSPFIFKELYRLFKTLEIRGCGVRDITKLLKIPGRISNYQFYWASRPIKKIPEQMRNYLACNFIKLLKVLRNNNPLCEDFKNEFWSKEELKRQIAKNKNYFIKADPQIKKIVAQIDGFLMSYCEMIYYYLLDLSRNFHGLYSYKNKQILIKEFRDLKPIEVWSKTSAFPFNTYQQIGIYSKRLKVKFHFFGHHFSKQSPLNLLEEVVIKFNGIPIKNLKELKLMLGKIEEFYNDFSKYMAKTAKDKEFIVDQGIKTFFFPLKPLYDFLNEDWMRPVRESYLYAQKNWKKFKELPSFQPWSKERSVKFLLEKVMIPPQIKS